MRAGFRYCRSVVEAVSATEVPITQDVAVGESDDKRSGRRGFFRDALAQALQPLADCIEPHVGHDERPALLRPPGAIAERAFLRSCTRCGACVAACPAGAIHLLGEGARDAAGTPVVDPDRAPCRLCDGLLCTRACPTTALIRLARVEMVRMGTAELYGPTCRRSYGVPCTSCVDTCLLGDQAIRFGNDGPPVVLASGCVGCGMCQHACPTTPKAIYVVPATRR